MQRSTNNYYHSLLDLVLSQFQMQILLAYIEIWSLEWTNRWHNKIFYVVGDEHRYVHLAMRHLDTR